MALKPRPPIITVLGHVDHGKTTLLDYLRKTRVQAGEVGGMTQHIGAYQINYQGKEITFIDTPGHAAFNKMRERGAQVTDLVILVISAKDGVQPQTVESLRFIKESGVDFIVALNKMDLEGAKPDQVKAQLAENGVIVREYGGEIEVVEISAKTGKGVNQLLDNVLILTELKELTADEAAPLQAVVIESTRDSHRGPIARVIVQQGALKLKQSLCVGKISGRVKSLINEQGQQLTQVLPGQPAEILGLSDVPEVGSIIKDVGEATAVAKNCGCQPAGSQFDLALLMGEKKKLRLVVKADVNGTLEAITQSIDPEVVEVIKAEVGPVTDSDLEIAQTCGALVVVFGEKVSRATLNLADQLKVQVKQYEIIYHLLEDLEKQMLKLMDPGYDEVELGRAEVKQVFEIKNDKIAGIKVITGEINKHDLLHLLRADKKIGEPVITSMKHGKDDVEVVKAKSEVGLVFKDKRLDFQVGDIIVAYRVGNN